MGAVPGPPEWDGLDCDDRIFEELRRRRGRRVASAIGEIADRAPRRMPLEAAWRWAERKYDERQLAADAGTGWDPEEEYRSHAY